MDSRVSFGLGFLTGVVTTAFVAASAAPRLSAYVTRLAILEVTGTLGVPSGLLAGATAPVERRIYNAVRSRVAPWVQPL